MKVSFNELKSISKGAARGAGFDWGIAEEVSFAAVWLAKNGFNAAEIILNYLENESIYPPSSSKEDNWENLKGDLDPIITGVALLDLNISTTIILKNIFSPILIVPFISQLEQNMSLEGNSFSFYVGRDLLVTQSINLPDRLDILHLSKAPKIKEKRHFSISKRCIVNSNAWRKLEELTFRTYAPATEESRILGAGAGLSDND